MSLSAPELQLISETLGRVPNDLEHRIFDSLWSEHCSYRHSKPFLSRYKATHRFGALGVEANAGGVQLSDGQTVFFKIESHNHPSHIEPKEGAATGVGGILRDIFAMGARPIVTGDLLCFGLPDQDAWMRHLIPGVVNGISSYGNAIGVANAGGATRFDARYQYNILVNVFALGVRSAQNVIDAEIPQALLKNPEDLELHIFGCKTGRDGIGGASMASETFSEASVSKRPQVQISDPYMGKRLLEISLTLVQEKLVVALQDCGAAGLSGAVFEVCAQNKCGATVALDQVPQRVNDLKPGEIAVSESQERMVAVVHKNQRDAVASLCAKYDVPHGVMGCLDSKSEIKLLFGEKVESVLDPQFVCTGHQSLYTNLSPSDAKGFSSDAAFKYESGTQSLKESAEGWSASLQGCSREWIVRQYDQHVGGRAVLDPVNHPVSVHVATPDFAAHSDCQTIVGTRLSLSPEWAEQYPYVAAWSLVREAMRQLWVTGLKPLGFTNGLNFANPEKKNVIKAFDETIRGISEAAVHYKVPVVSGNVSLYNASEQNEIPPTVAFGAVGEGRLQHHPQVVNHYPDTLYVYELASDSDDVHQTALDQMLKNLGEVAPTIARGFFSDLKPIWQGFIRWMNSMPESWTGNLTSLTRDSILKIGQPVAWIVTTEPLLDLKPSNGVTMKQLGVLTRCFEKQNAELKIECTDGAIEILDLEQLKLTSTHTLTERAQLL